jgi:SAM-dependent methyltransferase
MPDLQSLVGRARRTREIARIIVDRYRDPRLRPWRSPGANWAAVCNICGWNGTHFEGPYHSEFAACPYCGSVARDRYQYRCFTSRTSPRETHRILETSPRLGSDYREAMAHRFDYLCSDFDLSAHKGSIFVDLQNIDLPDESFDAVLTAHVLEHVPDYRKALGEVFRILRPGGRVFLNVPIVADLTSVPTEPEYHQDNTLVHWRFGFDLADDLRAAGFETTTLVTEEFRLRIRDRDIAWAEANNSDTHDTPSMVRGVDHRTLTDVAGIDQSARFGFLPAYMFVVFEGRRPGDAPTR